MTTTGAYREQLAHWAQALARAEHHALDGALSEGSTAAHVKLFTDGNLDKRFSKLDDQLEFVAAAFDEDVFARWLEEYIQAVPLAAYDTGTTDGDRFLDWLARTQELTAEELDHVRCQQARHAVEELARRNRPAHVRFQEMWSVAGELAAELDAESHLVIHVNPIRTWETFQTDVLLEGAAEPPARVLFFANRSEIATALLSPDGQELLCELARFAPCRIDEWAMLSGRADAAPLVALARDLVEMGLAALA